MTSRTFSTARRNLPSEEWYVVGAIRSSASRCIVNGGLRRKVTVSSNGTYLQKLKTYCFIPSNSLPSFSTSIFPSSSSIHPGNRFPPMMISSSHSSSNTISPRETTTGMFCPGPIPFGLVGISLGPGVELLPLRRRDVSSGGKGGMMRPPDVDGCESGESRRLAIRD